MAVIGTFGSFTAARLGIYASQSSLNVTGNNIANINTKGYTRQRMDLVSLYTGGDSRYANKFNMNIGYGVITDGVSQLRDPFLDIRYRDENSHLGFYEAKLKGLQQLSNVLDEVGMGKGEFGIIERQFNDFLQQLQNLNNRVNSQEYDTTVRSSAESLVNLFHDYSEALTRVKDNQLKDLQGDVKTVNTTLEKIRALNVEIRNAGIYGDKALELRDQRNVLIDELSSYIKIDVRYDEEKLDEFSSVERLNITLAGSGNPPIKLIEGVYGTQLSMPEETLGRNPSYDPTDITGMRYLDMDGNPTDLERLAARNPDDSLVANPAYSADAIAGHKYVAAYNPDGSVAATTDDPAQAVTVNNAKAGADNNHLWMSFEPLVDERGRYLKDEYGQDITETVDLGDNDLYGSLQAKRELLTEEGEFASEDDIKFDPEAKIKRGIPYYQRALDALARKFAESFNAANTTEDGQPVLLGYETEIVDGVEQYKTTDNCLLGTYTTHTTKDGKTVDLTNYLKEQKWVELPPEMPADVKTAIKELQEEHLSSAADVAGAKGHGYPITGGGILFSISGDSNDTVDANGVGITAANISISKDWGAGSVRLLSSKNYNILENTTANDNIYHMIELMGEKKPYTANEIKDIVADAADGDKPYFEGTFQQRLADINTILATDQETTTIEYDSYELTSLNLDNQRQSVSGVDLNDEATNMMMFQKSYAAACQLMTTLDSMLDKLINGTIR